MACMLGVGAANGAPLQWTALPPLPRDTGFAGMYAGTSNGVLIAAGGHRFADGLAGWQKGARKHWNDEIYVLKPGAKEWLVAATKLSRPLGDGATVSYHDEAICLGGGDAAGAYTDVFALRWDGDHIATESLPSLPAGRIKLGAVVVGDSIFAAGGLSSPAATATSRTFWELDLSAAPDKRAWKELPPWPGPSRMMAIMAADDKCVYLIGGIEVAPDANGHAGNVVPYLQDAYRFVPAKGSSQGHWERLANPPHPVAGSPNPAWFPNRGTLLIFGGVDGSIEAVPKAQRGSIHQLPRDILEYSCGKDAWTQPGDAPPEIARVNAPACLWAGGYAIISGEHLPGVRTGSCYLVKTP